MKKGHQQSPTQTIPTAPARRFGMLFFVPLLAFVGLLLLFWHISPIASLAQTPETPELVIRYAVPNGSTTSTCTTAAPCTLQRAVTLSTLPTDEVRALEGPYTTTTGTPTLLITRTVWLRGGYGPGWSGPNPEVYPSILKGLNGRVIEVTNNAAPIIDGFHITDGSGGQGAGIWVGDGNPTIRNNQIYQNTATNAGGGIYVLFGESATILFNNIHDNSGGSTGGGGVFVGGSGATALLDGNLIYNNNASTGAGLYVNSGGDVTTQNNMFYDNDVSGIGGAIRAFGNVRSWHNTIVGNHANNGGGGIHIFGNVQISNTIVASNTSNINPGGIFRESGNASGDNNNIFNNGSNVAFTTVITDDPEFINSSPLVRNLHLRQTSPDVNTAGASSVTTDIDGQVRPEGSGPDIGADEFYPNIANFFLTPSRIDHFYADRGTWQSYDHRVTNDNTTEGDTYSFECVNSQGWDVICPGSQTVPLGGFITVTTQVSVPASATALMVGDTIITATSQVSSTLSRWALVRTVVRPQPALQFTPDYDTTAPPGEIITLTHTLTNTGDAPDVFTVTVTSDSLNWADLLPTDPLLVPLNVGASTDIQVRVTIPPYAASIVPNVAVIRATSRYDVNTFAEVVDTVLAEQTIGTRYVRPVNSTDDNNNCTQTSLPCQTVEHAIDQAVTNDAVHIGFGDYEVITTTQMNETIHLLGSWGHDFREQGIGPTRIMPEDGGAFQLFVLSGAANRSTFDHLTLQGGTGTAANGGAIVLNSGVQVNFNNVIFRGNQATRGGAVHVGSNALAIFDGSSFYTNTATVNGGAVHVLDGTAVFRNALFNQNQATGSGGALYIQNSSATMNFSTIVDNSANNGAGIYVNNSSVGSFRLANSILADNTASSGGGALHVQAGTAVGDYNNFFNNAPDDTGGGGTINLTNSSMVDPEFVAGDPEFHLETDSPMVDHRPRNAPPPSSSSDELEEDFEGDGRPSDQGFDLGHDEVAGCSAKRDDTIFGSIQEAIDMPNPQSDLILVSGICRGVNSIDVNGQTVWQTVHITGTETLTIQGGWDGDFEERRPDETTYVDPQGLGRALYVSAPASVTVEFLTLQNGNATGLGGGPGDEDAGGLVYNQGATVMLRAVSLLTGTANLGGALYNQSGLLQTDLLVAEEPEFVMPPDNAEQPLRGEVRVNEAASNGGAFYFEGGTVALNGLMVLTNTAVNGGGLYHAGGVLTAANSVFAFNDANTGDGGAIYNTAPGGANLLHLTFYENVATSEGGAVYNQGSDPVVIRSNIFQSNDAATGDAVFAASTAVEDYNYYHNQPNPIAGGLTIGGNSTNSTTPPGLINPDGGEFHLENEAPAVDAGDPASPVARDFDDDPRPTNQAADMGADEVAGCRVELNGVIYGSIQAAMENAQTGDTIRVSGTCSGVHTVSTGGPPGGCRGDNGDIQTTVHIYQNVILQGGWDEDFENQEGKSLLDANGLGRVIYIAPDITATVEGFTIANGALTGLNGNGAGICIDTDATPTIRQNNIINNTATNGAAIYSTNSGAVIDGNRIYDNQADTLTPSSGGGIYAVSSNGTAVTIWNNFIYDNFARTNGGAFYSGSGNHRFWHNTVVANTLATSPATNQGAAVYVAAGNPEVRSNIFLNNNGPATDGVHCAGSANPLVTYNDAFGQTINYGGAACNDGNNLSLDPMLTPTYTLNIASPMLDAGDPLVTLDHDFEDDLRPSHLGFDMGADEIGGCVARNLDDPDTIYASLQQAVDDADTSGDTIQVDGVCLNAKSHPGSGVSVQNLFIEAGRAITIDGDWQSNLVPNTAMTATLDALDNGRVLYVASGGVLTLTNIHLVNGDANPAGLNENGGGVYNAGTLSMDNVEIRQNTAVEGGGLYNNGSLTIRHSFVRQNNASQGGGFYNAGGTAVITQTNRIENNNATSNGGGVYQNAGTLRLDGNHINDNDANNNGGGIYLAGGINVFVRNNFIYRNQAIRGGGLYNQNTDAPIWHNTFYGNTATNDQGGGLYSTPVIDIFNNIMDFNNGSGIHVGTAGANIDYNIVVNNSPANYSGNATPGSNDNTTMAPDYASGVDNFHLESDSPGVDDGLEATLPFNYDIDGDVRPTNGGPDRGADEVNTCLIRVIDPTDNNPDTREHIFGVLQFAIDYAEGFASGVLPTVEIARGECTGVRQDLDTGTRQVGIIHEDLVFEGSLRRLDFLYVGDYTSNDVGTVSSRINAQGEGRVLYIDDDADPTFQHLAFVNGNAAPAGGGTNGGGIIVPGTGSIELRSSFVCESTAVNGAGIYLSPNSSGSGIDSYLTGSRIGLCFPANVREDPDDGSVISAPRVRYEGNSATGHGGGLYSQGPLGMTNIGFWANTAAQNGGGFYGTANDTRIINGIFYSNTATMNGGGIFNTGANLHLYHNTITENSAQTGLGGGVRQEGSGFILDSSIINRNFSPNSAHDGLSVTGAVTSINFNNFYDDQAFPNTGSNATFYDPLLFPVQPSRYSQVLDRANEALLNGVPPDGQAIDFDARLYQRPDGRVITAMPPHNNGSVTPYRSDLGAYEYWKDFGCAIIPSSQGQTVVPGSPPVTYQFLVVNTGHPYPYNENTHGFTDTLTVTLSTSAGWGSLSGGPSFTLDWFEARPVTLTVSVPPTAQNGDYDLSEIECQSWSRPDRTFTAQATTAVGLISGIIVHDVTNTSAAPGDVLTLTHRVQNISNEAASVVIRPDAGAQHASAVLLGPGNQPITETIVTLAPQEQITVALQVTILDTALRGEYATPGVVAQLEEDPAIFSSRYDNILILGEPATRYVALGGNDSGNNCAVREQPCGTLNHAIADAAWPGDDILVAEGTYTDFSSEIISGTAFVQNVFITKPVNIFGGYTLFDNFATQRPITQTTRLDGGGVRRVFYITPGITVTLSGLFIENGFADSSGAPDYGGGVYNAGTNLIITATFFISNQARFGSALYQTGNELTVNSSVFSGNNDIDPGGISPAYGGGIMIENGTAVLENNTFVDNNSVGDDAGGGYGGAVFAGPSASLVSLNNIFSNNGASAAGNAVYITSTATVITSNFNLYWSDTGVFTFTNFITGPNSLIAEPDFLDVFYHLDASSPAKDAGTTTTSRPWLVDYDIQPRVQGPGIDIGADERVQRPGFALTPLTATAVITAGQPYTYRHVLTNTGDFTDTYTLDLQNQEIAPGGNWIVTLSPAGSTGVLGSGDHITLTLVVSSNVPGAVARTLITVTSTYSPSLTATAVDTSTVNFTPDVSIVPDRSGATAPAVPIVYSHTLTNTGNGLDRFALTVADEFPAGWTINIVPTQTTFLAANEALTFTVSVAPPPGTPPGVVHTATVEARSLNTLGIPVTDTLDDTTTVLEAAGLLLLPVTQTQTVPDNSTAVFLHTLQNTGNITVNADLAVSGMPASWAVNVEPLTVQLQPAATTPVTVTVTVPPGTGGLTHTSLVTATAQQDPTAQATAVDTTNVLIQAGVIIEPDNTIVTNPGTTVVFTHTVTNLSNGPETFDLSYVNTLTWTTTMTPISVTLNPNESAQVQVTVTVPLDAVPDSPNTTTVTAQSRNDPTVFDTATDLTRIRQEHSLIFIPDQTGVADPGTTISYTHWLTNTGNGTDEFMFTAVTQNGWQTITPPATVILPPDGGTQLSVGLMVPIGAAGRTEIMTVTATSIISPAASAQAIDTTNVTGTPGELGVEIAPDHTGSGNPGDTLIYTHLVTNTGTIPEEFLLSVASPGGWAVGVVPPAVILNAGESTGVQVTTTIPLTAGVGSTDVAVVTARSQTDASVFDTAQDTTTVSGAQTYGVIIAPDNTGTADAGQTITYTHWVTNTGSGTDTFDFTTVSSHGWLTPDPASVTLATGASTQIVATLIVPAAAITTTDVMTVTAVSINDPAATDSATDTTNVNGVSGTLGVLLEPDNTAVAAPGDTVQYQHWLTNTGTITDDYQITAVSSQGWTIVTIPASGGFIRLGPGQAASVVARVTVPGTATDGMVDVTTLTAVSLSDNSVQDLARDTTTVNVVVTPPTIYMPIIMRPGTIPITPTPVTPTPTATPVTPTPSPTPCAPPTGIDLIVTQIQVVPGAPTSGQPATVYVTIRNQGSQNVPFGNNFFLDFYVDRTPQPFLVGDIAWGVQGSDLTAGTSRTYQADYTFGGGTHQLWAQVDTDRHVNECPNENNNIFGPVAITVSGTVINRTDVEPQYGPRQTPEPVMPTGTPTPFGPVPTVPPAEDTATPVPFTPTPEATPTLPPPDVDEELPGATPTATATPD